MKELTALGCTAVLADGSAVSDAAHGLTAIRDLLRHSTAQSRRAGSEVTR